jgi:hypothetical protein
VPPSRNHTRVGMDRSAVRGLSHMPQSTPGRRSWEYTPRFGLWWRTRSIISRDCHLLTRKLLGAILEHPRPVVLRVQWHQSLPSPGGVFRKDFPLAGEFGHGGRGRGVAGGLMGMGEDGARSRDLLRRA